MDIEKEELMFITGITEEINNEEYEHLNLLFDSLDAAERLTNASLFVIDFAKQKMVFRTENLLFLDGVTQRDFQRESAIPYWSLIYEEDLDIMLESRKAYFNLFQQLTPKQKLAHTYIIDYRIELRHRAYVISQKFTPLKLRPDGKIWLGLFCITNSPNKSCEHIAVFGNGFRYTYDFEKKQFMPFAEKMELTLMEKAILLRASKGLTTEQIADDLRRSVNTIKTHKRRLFEKLHVSSTNEALSFTYNYDLY